MMRDHVTRAALTLASLVGAWSPAAAQGIDIRGYGLVGGTTFAASESFEAVLGSAGGFVFGGGAEVGLPAGGLYVGVGAWRFSADGERVFISDRDVFPLGIPVTVEITPIEITGGWRFRGISPRFVPYAGGGWSSVAYKESSSFAAAGEDVDDRFTGYHLLGGVDVRLTPLIGVAGELAWSSVPDGLGAPGSVSDHYDERDLGGISYRVKISLGR
jgi:hypothetical protein